MDQLIQTVIIGLANGMIFALKGDQKNDEKGE